MQLGRNSMSGRIGLSGVYINALHASRHQQGQSDTLSPTFDVGGPVAGNAMRYFVTGEASPRMQLNSGYLQGFLNGAGSPNSVLLDFTQPNLQFFNAAGNQLSLFDGSRLRFQNAAGTIFSELNGNTLGLGLSAASAVSRLHIRIDNLSLAATVPTTTTSSTVEANDAIHELISNNGGNWGSGVSLTEVTGAGALADKWGIIRRTTGGGGGSGLRFTFGVNRDIDSNTVQAELLSTGGISLGATPATTGVIRIANNQYIYQRNAANTADLQVIGYDGSNFLAVGANASLVAFAYTAAGAISVGGPILANSGSVRLTNDAWIAARNAANTNDVNLIKANVANQIEIGTATNVPKFSGTTGMGTGAATNLTAPALGGGSGPASMGINAWIPVVKNDGTAGWIPFFT